MKTVVQFDYAVGDKVIVTALERPGQIDGMMYDGCLKTYRVIYWNDGQRYTPWLNAWEIKNGQ